MAWDMNIRAAKEEFLFRVVNCPSSDLALSNNVFVNPLDAAPFAFDKADREQKGYVEIAGLVFTVRPHDRVEKASVALNTLHRRSARISAGDQLGLQRYSPPTTNFHIVCMTAELAFINKAKARPEVLDATVVAAKLVTNFQDQVFTMGQSTLFENEGTNFQFTVKDLLVGGQADGVSSQRGMLTAQSTIMCESGDPANIKFINQRAGQAKVLFKNKEFNFQKLGIGGLDAEFADIFRRAFASRVWPAHVIQRLGIQHVRGMLLYGPPGTGKTLIARQIGKMLNGKEPKVVNGPEVLNAYVGKSEENIRELFKEAEAGDEDDLYIIIFDEIDAICKQRGSTKDGTGVHDTIVNQLLTKIDGVNALNNILLIGMTNRKDLLDEALLRPGRLEVQIEIGLPDEKGRLQILSIHTSNMRDNSFMASDVSLEDLAERTKNFSGAEIEGLVKSAASFALNRQVNPDNLTQTLEEDNIKVTKEDFELALSEIRPAFGTAYASLEKYRLNGFLDCGPRHAHLMSTCRTLVEQVRKSNKTPLLTVLLEGPSGSGKSALAATLALQSGFPFVKVVSPENLIGYSEASKCSAIAKIFEDAYRSPTSFILLDDVERLLEFVHIGPRFSNVVLQTLLVLVKRVPPKGRKLFVVATTSLASVLESMDLSTAFNVTLEVPALKPEDIRLVLQGQDVFAPEDLESAIAAMDHEMPIKRLLMLVEMAAQGKGGEDAELVNAGQKKIDINHFYDCLQDLT